MEAKIKLRLFTITIFLLGLSSFLIWSGFQTSNLTSKIITPTAKPQASSFDQVLGIKQATPTALVDQSRPVKVLRVVDGDTIEVDLDGQIKKVRYIGVNTPETVDPRTTVQCFGKEASNENKKLVGGKEVFLEKDVSETDKYNRLLRYVHVRLDSGETLFVNDYLVRSGYALALTYPPDVKYNEQFREAETQAKENNLGLWGKCK